MNDSDPSGSQPFVKSEAQPGPTDLRRSTPAIVLVAVNLVPVVGVLFAGWSLLEVVALYWFENVVIGAINVLKMLTCAPDAQYLRNLHSEALQRTQRKLKSSERNVANSADRLTAMGHHAFKAFIIPFFIFHYGLFCLVHGVFVFALLGPQAFAFAGGPFQVLQKMVGNILSGGTVIAALALIGSHLVSYFYYFLYQGEFRRTNVAQLMAAPYGRIVVLHITILFGAFAIHLLGQPIILLILFIVGKTLLDWTLHVRAHSKLRGVEATY